MKKKTEFFLRKRLTIVDLFDFFKACGWRGHVFATNASAINRSFNKKRWLCHPLPLLLFVAVSLMLLYMCEIRVAIACGVHVGHNLGRHACGVRVVFVDPYMELLAFASRQFAHKIMDLVFRFIRILSSL